MAGRRAKRASRATEQGIAGHQAASAAMGKAIGWGKTRTGTTQSGRLRGEIYPVRNNPERDYHDSLNDGKGSSYTGQGHVNVIPAGSKPLTPKNSDWEPLPKY